jgi:hypothetical protein
MEMAAVFSDAALLREIASFLPSVVDVVHLFSTCKVVCFCSADEKQARSEVLRQTFLRNLTRGLRPFNLSGDAVLNALREDCASISGGFALQCVTGEFHDDSDVDFFGQLKLPDLLVSDSLRNVATMVQDGGYDMNGYADEPNVMTYPYNDFVVRTARR